MDEENLPKVPFTNVWIVNKEIDDHNDMFTRYFPLPGYPSVKYMLCINRITLPGEEDLFDLSLCCEIDKTAYTLITEFDVIINNKAPVRCSCKVQFNDDGTSFFKCPFSDLIDPSTNAYINNELKIQINGFASVMDIHTYAFDMKCIKTNKELYKNDDSKDFIIVVGNNEIKVHKSILIQNSKVFAAMFENPWKEVVEGRIKVPEFSYETTLTMVEMCYGEDEFSFMYKDKNNEWIFHNDDVIQLFYFADKYSMTNIKDAIKQGIIFTPNDIVDYTETLSDYDELLFHAVDYLLECSKYSIQIKDFHLLDDRIKSMVFERVFNGPALKKNLFLENKSRNDESSKAQNII